MNVVDDVILPKNMKLILNFLLENFTKKYNINQIAGRLNISVSDTHRVLKKLDKGGIVKATKIGSGIFYELNLENKIASKIAELLLIQREMNPYAKVYAKDLEVEGMKESSKVCILFGSILSKGEKARDVDVLIIPDEKEEKDVIKYIESFCLELSKKRAKNIQTLLHTKRDLESNIREEDEVILDIMKNGVVLWGEKIIVEAIKYGKH